MNPRSQRAKHTRFWNPMTGMVLKNIRGAGEMAQWEKKFTAVVEDLSSQHPHKGAHNTGKSNSMRLITGF